MWEGGRKGRGRTGACTDDWFPIFDLGFEGGEDLFSVCWRAHFCFLVLVLFLLGSPMEFVVGGVFRGRS